MQDHDRLAGTPRGRADAQSPGLSDLKRQSLSPEKQRMAATALQSCHGDAAWRARKKAEMLDVLALSELAGPERLSILSIDLHGPLRIALVMDVPVPLGPDEGNALRVGRGAMLGFTYPPEIARGALPGFAFFQILSPRRVWLPQVEQSSQALCVAPQVPAGTRATALILMAYNALSMQAYQIDAADPAGVFDGNIAEWWQQNAARYIPLTREPFLSGSITP